MTDKTHLNDKQEPKHELATPSPFAEARSVDLMPLWRGNAANNQVPDGFPKLELLGKDQPSTPEANAKHQHKDPLSNTWIELNGISYHLAERDRHWNERNWGLGIEQKLGPNSSLAIGEYRNSIRHQTDYAMYMWEPLHKGPLKIGIASGLITGYEVNHGGPFPAVLPVASIEGRNVGANLLFIPPVGKQTPPVVGLQLKFRL